MVKSSFWIETKETEQGAVYRGIWRDKPIVWRECENDAKKDILKLAIACENKTYEECQDITNLSYGVD